MYWFSIKLLLGWFWRHMEVQFEVWFGPIHTLVTDLAVQSSKLRHQSPYSSDRFGDILGGSTRHQCKRIDEFWTRPRRPDYARLNGDIAHRSEPNTRTLSGWRSLAKTNSLKLNLFIFMKKYFEFARKSIDLLLHLWIVVENLLVLIENLSLVYSICWCWLKTYQFWWKVY